MLEDNRIQQEDRKVVIQLTESDPLSISDFQAYWGTLFAGPYLTHLDREAIRHGLWKEYPMIDQARQMKIKADRVMHTLEGPKPESDVGFVIAEIDDIINYGIFATRLCTGAI